MTSTPGRFIPGIDPAAVTPVPLDGERVTGRRLERGPRAVRRRPCSARCRRSTRDDVDRAVAAAKRALHDEPLPQWRRAEILDRAALLLAERQEDFARCIALEAAKPIRTARAEAQRAVQHAAVQRRRRSLARRRGRAAGGVLRRRGQARASSCGCPIGVVGAIAPFNFPLNLVAHKLGPAIAAGCPVVLKPASQTPFSSILLARLLLDERGLPARLPARGDRRRGRWSATPSSTTTTSRSSRSRARPRWAGASGRARRASGSASSSATTRR